MELYHFIVVLIITRALTCSGEFNWIEGIEDYASKHENLHQVIFVSESEETLRIPGMSELFRRIAEHRPIIQISANNSDMFNKMRQDTASTLFIYTHTPFGRGILPSTKIIDAMMEASFGRTAVRYLIIHYSNSKNDYLSETLKHAWRRQILHCTIIELLYNHKKMMQEEIFQVLVHLYKPFLNQFITANFSSQTELFPNTPNDMNGYPFKIRITHDPPFSTIRRQLDGTTKLKGANMRLIDTLAKAMNFTVKAEEARVSKNDRLDTFLQPLMNREMDIYAHLYAHPSEHAELRSLRTEPIDVEHLCAIVPYVAKKNSQLPSMGTICGYLLVLLIVVLFWILEHFTHLNSHYWSPWIVIKLLFGVVVVKRPNRCADRIMFGVLCLVSIVYLTKLYSSLTGGIVYTNEVNKWLTLEDLVNSDLIPFISPLYYNKTFSYATGVELKLKEKVKMISSNMMNCLNHLAEHKNISCIMSKNEYKVFQQYETTRRTELLVPCLIVDSSAFSLSKNSPYHEHIDHLIRIFRDVGLKNKWYDIGFSRRQNITQEESYDARDVLLEKNDFFQQCIIILTIGYTLATIALLGELIYYHKCEKKHSSVSAFWRKLKLILIVFCFYDCRNGNGDHRLICFLRGEPLHYEGCRIKFC
ncbi:uncharacterized protein LOC114841191 [Diachasma alloeum]|uniref:Ionotropic receptor 126 n=1 Tax=Diachasma alloeum TaxID=454923 RepID=A0A4E0RYX6_9HYME|nr:uncharacterized protein LOC114841191 [Diachasma alloeum]THK33011.1 ionotropic receptor 126 [Diachasma alloeum]